MNFKIVCLATVALFISTVSFFYYQNKTKLPIISIANYGSHSSLEEAIHGIKKELARQGFIHNKNIKISIADVGFDLSLIPQMVSKLKSEHPTVMIAMTTPVAQFAKNAVKDLPLIFTVITDPLEAGLLKQENEATQNITGASDKQNLAVLLDFSKKIMPKATTVGVLFATSEANDFALVNMLKVAASQCNMKVVAIPIDQARDVPLRMQAFKGKVDFIYVGASGPIQPSLPSIKAQADKMGIPILNVNQQAVLENQVLASFGVDYQQVGVHTGQIVARILNGEKVEQIAPIYPSVAAHKGFISLSQAKKYQLIIPFDLTNITVVE